MKVALLLVLLLSACAGAPPKGNLRVSSNVPGQVFVDDTLLGDTPYEGSVQAGTRVVVVRQAGYLAHEVEVHVVEGQLHVMDVNLIDADIGKIGVRVLLTAVDTAGDPVAGVGIQINGTLDGVGTLDGLWVGETDAQGQCETLYPASKGFVLTFDVKPPDGYRLLPGTDPSTWRVPVVYPPSGVISAELRVKLERSP